MASAETLDRPAVRSRRRIWPIVVGLLVAAAVALIALWDWDWFRPIVEARASAAIGRRVTMRHFDLHVGWQPMAVMDDIEVENPQGFPEAPYFAHAGRLAVTADARAYLHGRHVVIPRIEVTRPDVNAIQHADGHATWDLGTGGGSGSGPAVQIGDVVIADGEAHVVDPKLRADFRLGVHTDQGQGHGHPQIMVDADGTYAGQRITGHATGGGLLSLRDAADPYPIDAHIANGPTKVDLTGTVQDPLHFKGTNLRLHLSGPDMALLMPLTGVPVPKTPNYDVTGMLDYADRRIRFSDFAGRLGSSDIGGTIAVDPTGARPVVQADLASRSIDMADLGGFVGSEPGRSTTPGGTAEQKRAVAKAEASSQLLPNTPINLPKLQAADVHLTYKAAKIAGRGIPFDTFSAVMDIVDGAVRLHPIQLGVGRGSIGGDVALTPLKDADMHATADIRFDRVDVGRMLEATGAVKGAGLLGGRASIDTTGNSVSSLLGHGDGGMTVLMAGGNLSALIVDLSGLEFGNALLSALGIPNRAQLECLAGDFALKRGVLDTRTMLIVTSEADVVGTGSIDLGREALAYRIRTDSRHFSVGSLPTDIGIGGTFKSPSIRPAVGELAARGGAAVALGVLLTPLGALLPTVQFGTGDTNENRCVSVVHANGKNATPASAATPPSATAVKKPKKK